MHRDGEKGRPGRRAGEPDPAPGREWAPALAAALAEGLERAPEGEPVRPIAAVYLYGSAVCGGRTPLSDLDLAVLLREGVSEDERGCAIDSVAGAAASVLAGEGERGEDVDVRDLERLPLALQGSVLTDGVLLLSRDEVRRVRFEEVTRRRYHDFLPFQQRDTEEGLRALRERFGGGRPPPCAAAPGTPRRGSRSTRAVRKAGEVRSTMRTPSTCCGSTVCSTAG